MDYRVIGRTGIKVSPFCLGAMMFGAMGNADHDDCVRIIHRALDGGINFIDTADFYSQGESEIITGKALKGRRDDVVLATKFYFPIGKDINRRGGSRRWIMQAVEESLKRLGTDYIDLYQLHRYDDHTDVEEILFALTDLVRQGKIRSFGSSMFPADRIVEAQWTAEKMGLMRFRCEQPNYSIFTREIERFVLPACQRYGMGAIVWSPLDGGYLSGKYKSPDDLKDTDRVVKHVKAWTGKDFDRSADPILRKFAIIEQLLPLAEASNLTLAQLAVAFTLEHPGVTSAIIGPRTMPHLETLLPAMEARLSTSVLDKIDALVPQGSSLNVSIDQPSGTNDSRLRRRSARTY